MKQNNAPRARKKEALRNNMNALHPFFGPAFTELLSANPRRNFSYARGERGGDQYPPIAGAGSSFDSAFSRCVF